MISIAFVSYKMAVKTSFWHQAYPETTNNQFIYLCLESATTLHLNEHDVTEERLQLIFDVGGFKMSRQLVIRESMRWMM